MRKNSPQSQDSIPAQLGEKCKCYLCCPPPPPNITTSPSNLPWSGQVQENSSDSEWNESNSNYADKRSTLQLLNIPGKSKNYRYLENLWFARWPLFSSQVSNFKATKKSSTIFQRAASKAWKHSFTFIHHGAKTTLKSFAEKTSRRLPIKTSSVYTTLWPM